MEVHEEGREDEEEDVGECVDKLCNVGGEGVVLLAPVHRARPTVCVLPVKNKHAGFIGLASSAFNTLQNFSVSENSLIIPNPSQQ